MDKFLVTLIVASKDPPLGQLIRCISSFASLKYAHKMQLLLVESGEKPDLPSALFLFFADVQRLLVPPDGVYAAYNSGIFSAEGKYLLFFGVDDLALPSMDRVLEKLETSSEHYSLFAASCYMQSSGISMPSTRRVSLLFANWCHQGIFYCRQYLLHHPYNVRYKMQADHALNISIASNRQLKIGVSGDLVAFFSAGGISSTLPDLIFRQELSSIAKTSYGRHWGWFVRVKQIIVDLLLGPPVSRF